MLYPIQRHDPETPDAGTPSFVYRDRGGLHASAAMMLANGKEQATFLPAPEARAAQPLARFYLFALQNPDLPLAREVEALPETPRSRLALKQEGITESIGKHYALPALKDALPEERRALLLEAIGQICVEERARNGSSLEDAGLPQGVTAIARRDIQAAATETSGKAPRSAPAKDEPSGNGAQRLDAGRFVTFGRSL